MKPIVGIFEPALVNVSINLRCRDVSVTEHLLDDAKIGAIIQEVRRKTVSQGVGCDVFGDSSMACVLLDEMPNRLATEWTAARGQKHFGAIAAILADQGTRLLKIALYPADRLFADRHDPLLAAFADSPQESGFKINFAQCQFRSLADAQARCIHQFEHGFVTQAEFRACWGSGQEAFDFLVIERVWQCVPELGRINRLGDVSRQYFFAKQKTAEHANCGKVSGYAPSGQATVALLHQIVRDVLALDRIDLIDSMAAEETHKLRKIGAVCSAGVGRQPPLDRKMIQKRVHQMVHAGTSSLPGNHRVFWRRTKGEKSISFGKGVSSVLIIYVKGPAIEGVLPKSILVSSGIVAQSRHRWQ